MERYYGREVAQQTAYEMEYEGQGWLDRGSNQVYAAARRSTDAHPLCLVCDMDVDDHRRQFDAAPAQVKQALVVP